jgi:hypothetical protein
VPNINLPELQEQQQNILNRNMNITNKDGGGKDSGKERFRKREDKVPKAVMGNYAS